VYSIITYFFDSLQSKVQNRRKLIIFLILSLFTVRLIGDFAIYFLDISINNYNLYWSYTIGFSISGLLYLLMLSFEKPMTPNKSYEQFSRDLKQFVAVVISFLFIIFIAPTPKFEAGVYANSFAVILSNVIGFLALIIPIAVIRFVWKWLSIRRKKNTLIYLIISLILIKFAIVFQNLSPRNYSNFSIIIYFAVSLVIYLANENNNWVKKLEMKQKINLFFFCLLAIGSLVISLIIVSNGVFNLNLVLESYFNGAQVLFKISMFIGIFYFSKPFLISILSWNAGNVIEKQNQEMKNLANFNQLISKTIDRNELYHHAANLVVSATSGDFSWIETYSDESKTNINASNYYNVSNLENAIFTQILQSKFLANNEAVLIETMINNNDYDSIIKFIPECRSLIATPIFQKNKRLGTLVVVKYEDYGFESDDLSILNLFANNLSIALENSTLIESSIQSEQFKRELDLAREIQLKLLPQSTPKINNYQISGFSIPAESVGGDYYDFIRLKNGKFCILIGDVSGKGMSAAFYMAQIKGIVIALANESNTLKELFCKINTAIYGNTEKKMFISFAGLQIDEISNKCVYVRAGHLPLYLSENGALHEIRPNGIGMGITNTSIFEKNLEEFEFNIIKNTKLLLLTDGILENRNEENEEFGEKNLLDLLTIDTDNADEMNLIVKNRILNFNGNMKQHDDLTVVTLIYTEEEN